MVVGTAGFEPETMDLQLFGGLRHGDGTSSPLTALL